MFECPSGFVLGWGHPQFCMRGANLCLACQGDPAGPWWHTPRCRAGQLSWIEGRASRQMYVSQNAAIQLSAAPKLQMPYSVIRFLCFFPVEHCLGIVACLRDSLSFQGGVRVTLRLFIGPGAKSMYIYIYMYIWGFRITGARTTFVGVPLRRRGAKSQKLYMEFSHRGGARDFCSIFQLGACKLYRALFAVFRIKRQMSCPGVVA